MSMGTWPLGQGVLLLIRLERVSCGLGWGSGAARQPLLSIKQTVFSLIAGCSNSLMCWNEPDDMLKECVWVSNTNTARNAHLWSLVSELKLYFSWMKKNVSYHYVCRCGIAYYGIFLQQYLKIKAFLSKLLLKWGKMLKQFCFANNATKII